MNFATTPRRRALLVALLVSLVAGLIGTAVLVDRMETAMADSADFLSMGRVWAEDELARDDLQPEERAQLEQYREVWRQLDEQRQAGVGAGQWASTFAVVFALCFVPALFTARRLQVWCARDGTLDLPRLPEVFS